MKKDFKPKWAPITEVPVIPVHEDMAGRDEPDQHPIQAIAGLEDALGSKVDAQAGKGLSTEDYTAEDKAKLALVEDGAERNAIESVIVNGAAVAPDGDRAVRMDVPTASQYAVRGVASDDTGRISLRAPDGTETGKIDNVRLNEIFASARWDEQAGALMLTRRDGAVVAVPIPVDVLPVMGDNVDIATSSDGEGIVVSLTGAAKASLEGAVKTTGDQTVAGRKTFTGTIVNEGATGSQWLRSTKEWGETGQYSAVNTQVNVDGASKLIAYDDVYSQDSGVLYRRRVALPDGTASAALVLSLTRDGTGHATAPVHVVPDGQGGYSPTPSSEIVTGAALAVDPQVVHTYGAETVAGNKTFVGSLSCKDVAVSGGIVASGSVSSKSVVTPGSQIVESEERPWFRLYTLTSTTQVTYTLLLWSSPTSPVVSSAYPMGLLMASVRGTACVLKWHSGMDGASADMLQRTALVSREYVDESGTAKVEWSLWQRADRTVTGRYMHRLCEYTMNGPGSSWTALNPTAEDAAASLPSGEGITVHYSEA